MTKVYAVASGKGGTGKTMTVVNLGTALALLGKSTVILDADIGMANLGLVLGLERSKITLHEVLSGEADVSKAIYNLPTGLKVVPSGMSLKGFQDADPDRLQFVMSELIKDADFVIIDTPAGINKDGVVPLAIADEVLLVVNPELSSLLDAAKVEAVVDIVGGAVAGIIVNRVPHYNIDLAIKKIGQIMNSTVLGVVPEDSNARIATTFKIPMIVRFPDSPASLAYMELAQRIASGNIHDVEAQVSHPVLERKQNRFVERLTRSIFGG